MVLGADSRTSSGSYVANRVQDKITPLAGVESLVRSSMRADSTDNQVQLAASQMHVP